MIRTISLLLLLGLFGGVPALAQENDNWRSEIPVFRVGFAAGTDIADAIAATEPFRLAMEEALGLPVEMFAARDYTSLVDANVDSRIEYSVLSATAYAAASNLCECLEPLAVASSASGETGFRNTVIVPADGPSDLARLRGRLAVLDTGTVGGEILALHELSRAGIIGGDNPVAVDRYASSIGAFAALREGEADALLGWEPASGDGGGTMALLSAANGEDSSAYRVIWRSSEIPYRLHAIRTNMPAQAKTILRSLLNGLFDTDPVAYDSIEPIHGGGFVPARRAQFAVLKEALASRGIKASRPAPRGEPGRTGSSPAANDDE